MVFDLWHPVRSSLHQVECVDRMRDVRLGDGDGSVGVVAVDVDDVVVGVGDVIVDALQIVVDKLCRLIVVIATRCS